jgi:hypothetical protein
MRHAPFAAILLFSLPFASAPALAAGRAGFSLSVIVDGCEAPEYEHGGRIYVEALRGRDFALRLSNPTSERIAVAVSVDCRNVIDADRTTAYRAAKWILYPGQTLDVPGWQVSGEISRKFFFTDTARSYAKWLGDTRNVGTIEAVFFREKRRRPQPLVGDLGADTRSESAEGAPGETAAPPSRDAQAQAKPDAETRRKAQSERYAATGIGDKTDFSVRRIEFEEDPTPVARLALRYEFRRELVRLGVIPRVEDDLAERERARGFEPRYAPDPYGHR